MTLTQRTINPTHARTIAAAVMLLSLAHPAPAAEDAIPAPSHDRPNIVWIIAEDMSPHFGCYGERTITTPHVDALAHRGVRFSQAFVTAPVCSTARSALITGRFQTSIGAHHHRSGRGELRITLPDGVTPLPVLFQQAGYYTVNATFPASGPGKTDYNFDSDPAMYDGHDWSKRPAGRPFFAQLQLQGGKLRNVARQTLDGEPAIADPVDPASVTLPPYYPDHPVLRDDWSEYLNTVLYGDRLVGRIMQRLRDEGLMESTVVFFLTDHGISHARGKQFCYDEGIRVPLIVAGPGIEVGLVRNDVVMHIDVAAESLRLAGIAMPENLDARPLFGDGRSPRDAVFTARDRCDETVDRIRAVRTERYKYIRNFYPDRPYLQPNQYKDHKPFMAVLRSLHAAGKLEAAQSLIMAPTRPPEELYDLAADPWETHNIARDPANAAVIADLRTQLDGWIDATADHGRRPESPAMYDSDMAFYLAKFRTKNPAVAEEIEANIKTMKLWASQGR